MGIGKNASGRLDMTRGPILRRAAWFALPICLGNMLQQLYSTVDTLVVGNFCGRVSLAAVGTSSQPVEILLCLFMGLGAGVSVLAAQFTGAGKKEELRSLARNANSLIFYCALPMTVLGIAICPWILRLMHVPEDTFAASIDYIRILLLGTLFSLGYNANAGLLRGLGDSQATLLFLVAACVINIVMDVFFVAALHLDVLGAALATILAQGISWLCSIVYIKARYRELGFRVMPGRLEKQMTGQILRIGLPLGVNNSLYSVGHVFMQSMVNLQGSAFMAGSAVGGKITGTANVAVSSFSAAAATFMGQNYGAKNYRRLVRGAWRIPLFSGAVAIFGGVVMMLLRDPVLALFTDDAEVLALAALHVNIVVPFAWMFAVFNCLINVCHGISVIRYPTIVNLITLWGVRIPIAYCIAHFGDGRYVHAALPVSFIFGMTSMMLFFVSKRWREIRALAREQERGEISAA